MRIGWRFVHLAKPMDGIYHCELDDKGCSADRRWFLHRELSIDGLKQLGLMDESTTDAPEGKAFHDTRQSIRGQSEFYQTAALALCAMFGIDHISLV